MHTFEERYEWDQKKAGANLAKHGVDFVDATGAFGDPYSLILRDDHPDEERYAILGMDAIGRLVVVVYTWRGDLVRVISARKATTTETRLYAANKQ